MDSEAPVVHILRLRPRIDGDIDMPRYMTPCSAGMDLQAAVETDLVLARGEIALVPTGFAIELPPGYEAQIRPRSGLAVRHGIGLINSPGTIDADYRGEVQVAVINLGKTDFTIRRKDRIAQMVIQKVCQARLVTVKEITPTVRGSGGFGHTGM